MVLQKGCIFVPTKKETMTNQESQNIAATVGAFKISMDRAFDMGLTPDEFIEMFMENKNEFNNLVKSCKNYTTNK